MSEEAKMNNNNESLLTKSDVRKAFRRWQQSHIANYNYERLQASGLVWAMSPILRKLYGNDKEKMKDALIRHMRFFNTEPNFGGTVCGVTIAMEEQKAKDESISGEMIDSFKTGLMGPLAGIGDTLWQGTIIPILLSITLPFASDGNIVMGPVLFLVSYLIIMWSIAYSLWMLGYNTGREGILKIMKGSLLKKVMTFCQTLGPIVMGALAYSFVTVCTPLTVSLGKGTEPLNIQTGVLDQLIPGLLSLIITLGTYYLLKKKVKQSWILVIMFVGSIVLGALGILAAQ